MKLKLACAPGITSAFFGAAMLAMSPTGFAAEQGIAQLSWMAGCWKAPDAEPGSGEYWSPPAGGSMLGTSRTIRKGKLVEFEFMQLRTLEDGTLAFIAQPSGAAPTTFKLKLLDSTGVTFENPGHDFPQRVFYSRETSGRMSARIEGVAEGSTQSIQFPLVRVDCTKLFEPLGK